MIIGNKIIILTKNEYYKNSKYKFIINFKSKNINLYLYIKNLNLVFIIVLI